MKNDTYSIVTIVISFLLVVLLSFIPKVNGHKDIVSESNVKNTIKSISSSIGKDYEQINKIELSSDIINIVYRNTKKDDYKSYFIDKNTGKKLKYISIFKNSSLELFNETELRLLNLKYPKFIVDGIINSKTKRVVYIKNNSLVIIYNNVTTNPKYNDVISLTINFNEIDKYLNFQHELDEEYQNESAFDYDSSKKYVAFTFDDGPNKSNTNDIVKYLTDNKMRATFFMVGYLMENNPSIVKNVHDNSMEIGSHSWAHSNLKNQKFDTIEHEMQKVDEVYKNIIGEDIKLMRPPYGAINNTIKDTFNYSYILWNVDTLDWKYKDADHLYDFLLNNLEDGDIVLMHDLQSSTKVCLEKVLPELYVKGYRVVSVSELANIRGKILEEHKTYKSMK